jgi:predicted lipoprotein with Yx(FWY)xxD motif
MRTSTRARAGILIGLLAMVAVGCGRSTTKTDTAAAPVSSTAAPAASSSAPAAAAPAVGAKLGKTALGDVLVSDKGQTLYAFTNDVDAKSACSNKCAEAWPPVIVPADWDVGPGLDTGIFATTPRPDGQLQLVAGKWPLYTFAGDAAPGDVNGQGSGDVWFVVNKTGTIVKDKASATAKSAYPASTTASSTAPASAASSAPAAAPTAATAVTVATSPNLGKLLVNDKGLTLYGFTKDGAGTSTCEKACAQAWPPALVPSNELPAGLDAKVFSVIKRADGTNQLKAGKWPLYTFSGDAAPGDTNGQGSGGSWFVVTPEGTLTK